MAMTDRSVVVGVFQDTSQAQQAVHELQRAGFSDDEIRFSLHKGGLGILDGLMGLGFPHNEARFYNDEFTAGHTVVTVKAKDRQQEASDILQFNGAYDMHTPEDQRNTSQLIRNIGDKHSLQLREEVLQAQKQWVQTSEIRISRRIITEEKTFTVPVSREEVIIERVPLHTQPSTSPADTGASIPTDEGKIVTLAAGEPLKILVREEQVMFNKNLVVVEEITLTKRVIQEMQQFMGTVQRERLRFERSGNARIQGDTIDDASLHSYQEG